MPCANTAEASGMTSASDSNASTPTLSRARIDRLRDALCGAESDAIYVRNTSNIEWLTTFDHVFDEEQAHAMFVPANRDAFSGTVFLHTDSRYFDACHDAAKNTAIETDKDSATFSEWAKGKWDDLGSAYADPNARLAIEDTIALSEYCALTEAFPNKDEACGVIREPFCKTTGLIEGLRAVKDPHEIAALKAAQAVTDAGFAHIVGFIKPGLTERDVQLELDWFMLTHGADSLAFPTIVASGANGASPHAIVSDRVLQPGDAIVMDFGAKKDGYCSDMTRTVFLGAPEGEMLHAWHALRKANEGAEAMLKPGVTGKEAHEHAIAILDEAGFKERMGHGLGHGVGIDIHEKPVLSPRNEKPLQPGNVVTVEPGIYIPGRFGMRLEDFGVVTQDGFEVFTQSPHDMVVL